MEKKSFQKKGAIELSITTIIVIILGVTLLSLGLIWIRSTFRNIGDISESAFQKADGAISDILENVDETIVVSPPSIKLEQNAVETVQFIVTNREETPQNVKATVQSSDKFVQCSFADTLKTTSKEYKLESGKQVKIKVIVQEKGGPLGLKVCNLEVPTITGDSSDSLIVEIVSKQ